MYDARLLNSKLVRLAHNWYDGTMEYWNVGSFLHRIEKNMIYGQVVKIDPQNLDPNIEVIRF